MLQNDSHLNCLCVMARLIEALAIYESYHNEDGFLLIFLCEPDDRLFIKSLLSGSTVLQADLFSWGQLHVTVLCYAW